MSIPDANMDVSLEDIADNGEKLHLCSSEPANYAAVAGVSLGNVALTPGDGNGDFTIGDGDTSGRKLTLAEQSVTGSSTDTALFTAIVDDTHSELKATNSCNISVTDGVGATVAEFTVWEIRDPS
jgi:hypothetical protein